MPLFELLQAFDVKDLSVSDGTGSLRTFFLDFVFVASLCKKSLLA